MSGPSHAHTGLTFTLLKGVGVYLHHYAFIAIHICAERIYYYSAKARGETLGLTTLEILLTLSWTVLGGTCLTRCLSELI